MGEGVGAGGERGGEERRGGSWGAVEGAEWEGEVDRWDRDVDGVGVDEVLVDDFGQLTRE